MTESSTIPSTIDSADQSSSTAHELVDASRFDPVQVDLKNRSVAALLAWLWPGAGHIYQRRFGKAVLFMVCILVTFFWGLAMGDGHVVYASFRNQDMRYEYILQAGVGIPAMPALAQSYMAKQGSGPLFGSKLMAPPELIPGENHEHTHDEKAQWHGSLGFFFELGTLFTMVAGLLNLLAVLDAYSGPAFNLPESYAKRQADGPAAAPQGESVAGTIELVAMILGLITAMTIKYRMELGGIWSFVFAIVGGALGFYVGRALNRVIGSLISAVLPSRAIVRNAPATVQNDEGQNV